MPAITRFIAALAMVAATVVSAHAQSALADRIQGGDRRNSIPFGSLHPRFDAIAIAIGRLAPEQRLSLLSLGV